MRLDGSKALEKEPLIVELIQEPFDKEATIRILQQMNKQKDPETLLALMVTSIAKGNADAFDLFSSNPYLDPEIAEMVASLTFEEIHESASKKVRKLLSIGL